MLTGRVRTEDFRLFLLECSVFWVGLDVPSFHSLNYCSAWPVAVPQSGQLPCAIEAVAIAEGSLGLFLNTPMDIGSIPCAAAAVDGHRKRESASSGAV